MQGHFIAPREVPIGLSYEQAIEELDQFFALDFQTNRDCTLRYFDDGIRAIERTQSSPLLLVIHLALTLFTFGLWLIVWFVVATMRVSNRQKVRVRLIQEEDKITAELSGSDSWVQTTEAFIHRNLKTDEAAVSLEKPEREPCWKCGSRTTPADVRCPSCGAWLRPQTHEG